MIEKTKKTSSRKIKTASKSKKVKDGNTINNVTPAKIDKLCFVRGGNN